MKTKLLVFALSVILSMPCVLHAEEIEIQLMEIITMSPLPGDNPLDDPEQADPQPTRPTDFRAAINGNTLTILRQNEAIPSAQATVVNAQTGSIVVNEQFSTSLLEQISTSGVYVLHIETTGGALVGQFVVQ